MSALPETGVTAVESPQPAAKLISICIPTYNRALYLPETLESLLPQLGPDVELLVYDTGSTDGTPELVDRFQRRCPDLRFFALDEKLGFDETALLLLGQACGEYVWFFGSDDVLNGGAVDTVRARILQSSEKPSFIYLNHEVVGHDGNLLISSNVGRSGDREFRRGSQCVAWLGLHLGYISACVFRREDACPLDTAKEQEGSLWMGLYLNLLALAKPRPAAYIGQALVRARRNPGNIYDYSQIFCRNASRVFWSARKRGLGWFALYRAMNRTVRLFHFHHAVSRRCDEPVELDRALPAMFRTCWMYPWFWLLIVPMRLVPSRVVRTFRDYLRRKREQHNARVPLHGSAPVAREQE